MCSPPDSCLAVSYLRLLTPLQDLDYTFSPGGDIPSYIHSLSLPPAYFHRVVRTGPNPIIHADLSPWAAEILAQVQQMQDRHATDMCVWRSPFLLRV